MIYLTSNNLGFNFTFLNFNKNFGHSIFYNNLNLN